MKAVILLALLTVGCAPDGGVIEPDASGQRPMLSLASEQYADWSAPVNLGPVVNSAFQDLAPEISRDGLSLYFASNRPGGFGANDIYVSQRASLDEPWGAPVNLGAVINTASGDAGPHLSRDGHYMFFTSGRPGGYGSNDLYVSYRAHTHDDFAWETPVNLGPPISTSEAELGPHLIRPEFYFWRGPAGVVGAVPGDIYVSQLTGDVFGPPAPVAELNSPQHDEKPTVRFDGREILFASSRAGTLDIWTASRHARGDAWSAPVSLNPPINTEFQDRRPAISPDGTMLFFDSNRPGGAGNLDLYVTVRNRGGPSN